MIHLFDLSRGHARVAACSGTATGAIKLPEEFDKADPTKRCLACFGHFVEYKKWTSHCKICGVHLPDGSALADHESEHALTCVSYRLDPLTFTVNMQSHYDSPRGSARKLAEAMGELRKYFPEHQFTDPMPARLEIKKDQRGMAMLGEAFVAEYLIVQK